MPGLYKIAGSRIWHIDYRLNGKRYRFSTGTPNRTEAEALLGKIKAEKFAGTHFPEKKAADLTVGELRDRWLDKAARKRSLADDRRRFARIVEAFGEGCPVRNIETADVIAFRDELLKEPVIRKPADVSPKPRAKGRATRGKGEVARSAPARTLAVGTVNHHLKLLKAALRYAEQGLKARTARPEIELIPEDNERDRIATPEEYQRLIDAATDPKLRLAIVFGYWTAMRLGEIVNLRWEQVDLKAGVVRLKAANTKTREGRVVPLPDAVIAELRALPRPLDGGPVFPVEREDDEGNVRVGPVRRDSISPQFARLTRALGIKDLRFHDFRHTALTRLRREGVDVLTMQRISGHKTLEMLARYNTITEADLVKAVRRATERRGE